MFVAALSVVVLVGTCVTSISAVFASASWRSKATFPASKSPPGNYMVTDPVADFIIQLKNAGAVGKREVSLPFSNLKFSVAEKLKEAGYIVSAEKKGKKVKKTLAVTLKYNDAGEHAIHNVKRISKPGRRMYKTVAEITPVHYGQGALILSTPKGVLTDAQARKEKVGGEAMFEIW